MDFIRWEKLTNGENYMPSELLDELEHLHCFDEMTTMSVCVLCSDKRIKAKMDKFFSEYTDIDLKIYGTYEESSEEAITAAKYSDAVIVNTLALKIAPVGLYNVLKAVSPLNKVCYFILSGWESLPKNDPKLIKNKIAQINTEFEFSKAVSVKNAFERPMEGFYTTDDIFADYINKIMSVWQTMHKDQTEALYSEIMRSAKRFRVQLRSDIETEAGFVKKLQEILLQKEQKYIITFSHASVRVTEIIDAIEKTVSYISRNEIFAKIKEEYENPEEIFTENKRLLEEKAINSVSEMIISKLSGIIEKSASLLLLQTSSQITVCANDLRSVAERLNALRFVNSCAEYETEKLFECIDRTSVLEDSGNAYSESITTAINHIIEVLPAKINGYSFIYKDNFFTNTVESGLDRIYTSVAKTEERIRLEREELRRKRREEDKNPLKRVVNTAKDVFALPNDPYAAKQDEALDQMEMIKEISNTVETNSNQYVPKKNWNEFQKDLDALAAYAKNQLASALYDQVNLIKKEVDIRNEDSVRTYFSNISNQFDAIAQSLKQLSETFAD